MLPQNLFYVFSQASFVSSGNRTDISLDDPNFWQKWAKIAELEIDSKEEKVKLAVAHLFLSEKCHPLGQRISTGGISGKEKRKRHNLKICPSSDLWGIYGQSISVILANLYSNLKLIS